MKKIINRIKKMSVSKRIWLTAATLLTIALLVLIPVYAWFSYERKAAEMYKVQYPNSLYINAGHREDRVFFNLDGINVNNYVYDSDGKIKKDDDGNALKVTTYTYVFAVSGDNTTEFKLQMAHTNNNMFKYKIYEATQYDYPAGTETREADEENGIEAITAGQIVPSGTASANIVVYDQHAVEHEENPIQVAYDPYIEGNTSTKYYVRGNEVNGAYKNNKNSGLANDAVSDKYYKMNFGDNQNVEAHAIPSYWEASIDDSQFVTDSNKRFVKYFILEVDCKDNQENQEKKETDLIYFTVERTR